MTNRRELWPRELRLNAFQMASPGHTWAGLWRHPRDTGSSYNSLDYWVDLARTAERGLFDGVFLADVLGQYDVYGGSADTALARAAQAPSLDPFLVVPAMAQATRHLGFGVTANLTYEHPYPFARRITTLDHLTGGRVGWNIVTGYLESGARGMGQDRARDHDARYEAGEDFLAAAYKLWEGSWADDAVRRDRAGGVFTDPAKVHRIRHDGPYYRVDGRHPRGALAPAHAGPLPGRDVEPGPAVRRAPRGGRVPQRPDQAPGGPGRARHPRGRPCRRARPPRHPHVPRRHRHRGADPRRGPVPPRRICPLPRRRGPARPGFRLDRHRPLGRSPPRRPWPT